MAADLTLRLCQVDPEDGGLPGSNLNPGDPGYIAGNAHIALNDFVEGLFDVLGGYHTTTNLKTFYNMPANQQNQFDALWAQIASGSTVAKQIGRIHRVRAILTKWERRYDLQLNAYDEPDDIETHLGEIDQGFV